MASELCMNCFSVKGQYEICPFCGYAENTPPAQPHYLTPGMILADHFIVGTAIGAGGFGITYKCFDTTLGVVVAVKEFFPAGLVNRAPGESEVGLLSGDRQEQYNIQLKRFLMEAQSIAQFGKAKDIVNVYDFFQENGTAYIIMEYIDGVLLKDYLEKQGRMDQETALNIITPIIDAVKKIHTKGIIHRDISPDNIFISGDDSIKVFDFGAAQLNDSSEGKNAEKVIKVGYSAPEQYRDKSKQGFYTDIYSVGAILYQMLTGIKPTESTEREFQDDIKAPSEFGIEIEPNIDRAVMEAMAVRSELRFQSIQQFDDALHSKRIAEYPEVKLKKRKRRRNWIVSLSAALVLAVAVAIGLFSTVLQPENQIFDSELTEDTITVWVENQSQKAKLEEIAANDFRAGSDTSGISEETAKILRNNEKITVNIVDITENDPAATMEDKLQKAKEQGEMPDMFLSDHVTDLDHYDLISMEENVYDAINPEDYLYMSVYPQYFPDMKEMPTGINTLLLYQFGFDAAGKNTLENSSFLPEKTGKAELKDIVAANADPAKKEFTSFYNYSTQAGILQDSSCFDSASGQLRPDTGLLQNLTQFIIGMTLPAHEKAGNKKANDAAVMGNSVVSGVEYRRTANTMLMDTTQGKDKVNRLTDYQVAVVMNDGKMMVSYEDKYAISADSPENRQTACMRLLWIMLGEAAQTSNYVADGVTPFPINKVSFEEFFKYNAKYEPFKTMVLNSGPCMLTGKGSGEIWEFERGIWEMAQNSMINQNKIKEYCSEYAAREKKK